MSIPEVNTRQETISFVVDGTAYFATPASANGLYICPCSTHRGMDQLYSRSELEAHVEQLKLIYDSEYGPHQERASCVVDNLFDTPSLRSLGLCINTQHQLLICLPCGIALIPLQAASHLFQNHHIKAPNLTSILAPFSIPPTFSPTHTDGIPLIAGLQVHSVRRCSECDFAVQSNRYLKAHFKAMHEGKQQPNEFAIAHAQKFNNALSRSYFLVTGVVPAGAGLGLDEYIAKVTSSINNEITSLPPSTADVRNVSSWLRATRWNEHIAPYRVKDLCNLTTNPTENEFPSLKDLVSALLHDCCSLIDSTPTLVLQKLNSPDPAKHGIANRPFHKHQEYASSMASYATPVIQLVAMLLRRGSSYSIVLPFEIEEKLQILRESLPRGGLPAKEAIFEFLLAIWTHKWMPSPSQIVVDPTVHYLMISSLRDDGTFLQPKLFTNVIARLEYGMRCIFLFSIHKDEDIDARTLSLTRWFVEKEESTFNTIRGLQHLLSSVAYSTPSLPRVFWSDSEQFTSMLYQGAPITLSALATMFAEVEKDLVDIWENEITLGLNVRVEYGPVHDDLSNTSTGYSFLTDPRNICFTDTNILLRAIYADDNIRSQFVTICTEKDIHWNVPRLRQWLNQYSRLQRLQLMLANCTAGSPSRGTEITCMLRSNTPESSGRNIVFLANKLALICVYQKGSAIRGSDKLIPHALSGFSADLLLQDLALARPFAEFATHICFPKPTSRIQMYRTHVFTNIGLPFTTGDISSTIEEYSLKHLGENLGINAFRHISTAFRRKRCSRLADLLEEDGLDTIGALQSGHSRSTENRIYGLEDNFLKGAPEDLMALFVDASSDWQLELRLVPSGLSLSFKQSMACHFERLLASNLFQLRGGSSDTVQSLVSKAITPMFQNLTKKIDDMVTAFKSASGNISVASTPPSLLSPTKTSVMSPASTPSGSEQCSKLTTLSSPSYPAPDYYTPSVDLIALQTLRDVLGKPSAQWVSKEQKEAVLIMLRQQQDLVALLPTGSGKTMIAIIPAMVEENMTTVVVCPLSSLIVDYSRRLDNLDIPYEVYRSRPLQGFSNLVLVSADSLKTKEWRHHLTVLNTTKKVVRFVFDEAHIPLSDGCYRPSLQDIFEMRSFLPVQVALLTGSLPPRAEKQMLHAFGISDRHTLLRVSGNRPELRFIWNAPSMYGAFIPSVITAAKQFVFQSSEDRGLIYVPSYDVGEKISSSLGAPFYTSHGVSSSEKADMYHSWISGKCPFMVCTTAFSAGNDYSHVRIVIHAGTPFHMLQYTQEVGRAGRDGKQAVCVMFPGKERVLAKDAISDTIDVSGTSDMINALKNRSSACIRGCISEFLDGTPTLCADNDLNEPCSVCQSHIDEARNSSVYSSEVRKFPVKRIFDTFQTARQVTKKRKVTNDLDQNTYITELLHALKHWADSCLFCCVHSDMTAPHHEIIRCPTLMLLQDDGIMDGVRAYRDFKSKIRYNPTQRVCFRCSVPQGPDNVLHKQFTAGVSSCEYPDLLVPLAFAIFYHADARRRVAQHFGTTFNDMDQYLAWIIAPVTTPHCTNLTLLLIWYQDHYSL